MTGLADMTERRLENANENLTFDCTMCGRCCHDLRLPVSVEEAVTWIDRGGHVELLCDARPLGDDGDYGPSRTTYQHARAFAAISGDVPVHVSVTLVATFAGPCPFLLPDMRCGNYEARPRVCRIYPAEVNPFIAVDPCAKACPNEAWAPHQPPLLEAGRVVDPTVRESIDGTRRAGLSDAGAKRRLCRLLGIDIAAFGNEGLAVHVPPLATLRNGLVAALRDEDADADEPILAWRISTNRATTYTMLRDAGCDVIEADARYIAFFPSNAGVLHDDAAGRS